jgi:hypothetical protein
MLKLPWIVTMAGPDSTGTDVLLFSLLLHSRDLRRTLTFESRMILAVRMSMFEAARM